MVNKMQMFQQERVSSIVPHCFCHIIKAYTGQHGIQEEKI